MIFEDLVKPTAEEVRGWLDQSVGKYFKAYLQNQIQEIQDDWANGDFTGETEVTIQRNSEALGKVQQIAGILVELDEWSTDDTDSDENSGEEITS